MCIRDRYCTAQAVRFTCCMLRFKCNYNGVDIVFLYLFYARMIELGYTFQKHIRWEQDSSKASSSLTYGTVYWIAFCSRERTPWGSNAPTVLTLSSIPALFLQNTLFDCFRPKAPTNHNDLVFWLHLASSFTATVQAFCYTVYLDSAVPRQYFQQVMRHRFATI